MNNRRYSKHNAVAALVIVAISTALVAVFLVVAGCTASTTSSSATTSQTQSQATATSAASTSDSTVMTYSSASWTGDSASDSDLVAATVTFDDGTSVQIAESTITTYIQNYRSYREVTDDQDWAQWLADNDQTAMGLRSDVIESFIERAVIQHAADVSGLTISDDAIQSRIQSVREDEELTDDTAWEAQLKKMSYTDESYTEEVRFQLTEEMLFSINDLNTSDDEGNYVLGLMDAATIQENGMPHGLPYDIEPAATKSSSTSASAASAASGSVATSAKK